MTGVSLIFYETTKMFFKVIVQYHSHHNEKSDCFTCSLNIWYAHSLILDILFYKCGEITLCQFEFPL